MAVSELFAGMEGVWAVWLVSVGVLAGGAWAAVRRFRTPTLADVVRDEQGVSYSLSYVLVVPFYLFFFCMVYESSLLLLAKIGTLYSAHAGARSAAVWQSARPAELRQERVQQSVFTAMAPFVSARSRDLATARALPPGSAYYQAGEFVLAYQFYSRGGMNQPAPADRGYARANAPAGYLFKKYLNAAARTTFEVGGNPNEPGGPTTLTVTYRAPLLIPGVNRFLDPDGHWPYEMEVVSRATMPNETPVSADHSLGIDYHSR
jgi:hypothetical protein